MMSVHIVETETPVSLDTSFSQRQDCSQILIRDHVFQVPGVNITLDPFENRHFLHALSVVETSESQFDLHISILNLAKLIEKNGLIDWAIRAKNFDLEFSEQTRDFSFGIGNEKDAVTLTLPFDVVEGNLLQIRPIAIGLSRLAAAHNIRYENVRQGFWPCEDVPFDKLVEVGRSLLEQRKVSGSFFQVNSSTKSVISQTGRVDHYSNQFALDLHLAVGECMTLANTLFTSLLTEAKVDMIYSVAELKDLSSLESYKTLIDRLAKDPKGEDLGRRLSRVFNQTFGLYFTSSPVPNFLHNANLYGRFSSSLNDARALVNLRQLVGTINHIGRLGQESELYTREEVVQFVDFPSWLNSAASTIQSFENNGDSSDSRREALCLIEDEPLADRHKVELGKPFEEYIASRLDTSDHQLLASYIRENRSQLSPEQLFQMLVQSPQGSTFWNMILNDLFADHSEPLDLEQLRGLEDLMSEQLEGFRWFYCQNNPHSVLIKIFNGRQKIMEKSIIESDEDQDYEILKAMLSIFLKAKQNGVKFQPS